MDGYAIEDSGDGASRAISAAHDRLAASDAIRSALESHDESVVRESVDLALNLFGGHPPHSVGAVVAGYAAELTAVGAICRSTTGEPPMDSADMLSLGDVLRRIFNGLFDR
ncbi:hypothetical protein [Arthrobacter sp.]|uniref:hypothetical protein n=1 Tax=Arthrobacter sp. TaxID=1667 RepID=UPI003A8D2410